MKLEFQWDTNKNETNIKKHGIDFHDVKMMFNYPMLVRLDKRKDYGEERWNGIGMLKNIIGFVAFTEKEDGVIRIISARKADKYESKEYQDEIKN